MLFQLRKANQMFRMDRPVEKSCTRCEVFRQGGLLEVAIPALRCCHDAEGSCIMCNYGSGEPIQSRAALESQVDAHLSAMGSDLKTLILCTNGSFLDDRNVPPDIQELLVRRAQASIASTVIIETHIDTLTAEKLSMVRQNIPSKEVILELGLESADLFIQKNCYLKEIPLEQLETVMGCARQAGFFFQLNVILGAPFLTASEQMDDAEQAIRWALEHHALAALFPMNIKPYTLLHYAYSKGLYAPISHWAIPLLLARFSSEELARIDLAWYGNREIEYDTSGVTTTFPRDCPQCKPLLQSFYQSYVLTEDGSDRRAYIEYVLSAGLARCDCMKQERVAQHGGSGSRNDRVLRLHKILEAELRRDQYV